MALTKRLAHEWNLTVDPEFKSLLAEHSQEERALFEDSLLTEGCRDAVVVWVKGDKRIIVDGHHRFDFCSAHDIEFAVDEKEFENRDAAKEWIIKNQLARRNLPQHRRAELALAYKPIIEAKAKENQSMGGNTSGVGRQNSAQPLKTRNEIAKIAGVSHDTIRKVEKINAEAPKPIVDASRRGEISVNAAYQITKMENKEKEEVVNAIKTGTAPKEAVKKALGGKKEDKRAQAKGARAERARMIEIIERSHGDYVPEYTLDMLVEDIHLNAMEFFNLLTMWLDRYKGLMDGDGKPRVADAIKEYVVDCANGIWRNIA